MYLCMVLVTEGPVHGPAVPVLQDWSKLVDLESM
jgi:hypothetical protein